VVACKPMWQNRRAYQRITNNPCPHIHDELLLVSTQYSFSYNSRIKCFRRHIVRDVFFFWYAELVRTVCPHLSVTLSICNTEVRKYIVFIHKKKITRREIRSTYSNCFHTSDHSYDRNLYGLRKISNFV
jgi:hypothetical protein